MPSLNALLIIAKELLIVVLLLSVIPLIKRLKYFKDANIRKKLRLLFFCGISLGILYGVLDLSIPDPLSPNIETVLNNSFFTFEPMTATLAFCRMSASVASGLRQV